MKISAYDEQNVSSDKDSSSMQHEIWAKSGAELPSFLIISKFGINVYLEYPQTPWNIWSWFVHQKLRKY
jgi:hypothetical protein